MPNLNRVLLMGNLTRDPDLRYLPSGMAVVQLGLAVNRRWRDQQSGEQREETTFIDCDAFGKQAELINQYMRKGRPLFVEGRLRLDQWQDKDGQNRSKLKVVVENFQFVDSRGGGEGDDGGGEGGSRSGGGYAPRRDDGGPRGGGNRDSQGPRGGARGPAQGQGPSGRPPQDDGPHQPMAEDDIPF